MGCSVDKIFEDFLNKKSFFVNKDALNIKFTPETIPHREEEINMLARILAPALRLERPSNVFIFGKTGCVAGDTLVYTNNGFRQIKTMASGDRVLSYNFETKKYEWEACNFLKYKNDKKLLKVRLDNGFDITVTKEHPLYTKDGWIKAEALKPEMEVANFFNFATPSRSDISDCLARLLGFIISDGTINQRIKRTKDGRGNWYNPNKQRLRYYSAAEELLSIVKLDIHCLCDCKATIYNTKSKAKEVQAVSQKLCDFLSSLGIPKGKKSDIVRIPNIIFNCSHKTQKEFLKALFSGDGTVSTSTYLVEYYSNSVKLLQDIQLLLYSFGIFSKIKYKKSKCNNKYFDSWRLYIIGYENLKKFYSEICFYNIKKKLILKDMIENYQIKRAGIKENIIFSKIIEIKETFEDVVYDLTMPKNHNFIANGIISHNTGKTLTVDHVTNQLSRIAKDKNIPLKVVRINCKMHKVADTEYRLIAEIARDFGQEIPATGLPTNEVYKLFKNAIDASKQEIILILDEIDSLIKRAGDEVLYNLTRINQELKNSKISIIGISNDVTFINNLDSRVKSSLSEEKMVFPPYDAVQLKDILMERAKIVFFPNTIQESVISKCAAYAAREHGDARKALNLLRIAGELAERSNKEKIDESDVDAAEEKDESDSTDDTVKKLPKQSQAVLYATLLILKSREPPILTGEMYDVYKSICIRTASKILTQRRVSDLINELDMLGILNAKVVSKGRYGRTRELRLPLAEDVVARIETMLKNELNL